MILYQVGRWLCGSFAAVESILSTEANQEIAQIAYLKKE